MKNNNESQWGPMLTDFQKYHNLACIDIRDSELNHCLSSFRVPVPAVMDCGYCLVGGVKFMEVLCRNEGLSAGTFCLMPKKQWPASSLRVNKQMST